MATTNSRSGEPRRIACVTGATGMIGSRIARRLQALGFPVRVLTRRPLDLPGGEVVRGDLADEVALERFVGGAGMVFHCAAELNDESRMHETNVLGTERLIALAKAHDVGYFCHLSSAGVIGRTDRAVADEDTPCCPQNAYEKSKHDAERLFASGIDGCKVVILRPTNVVDRNHLADLGLAMDGSPYSWLKTFIKGGECAHLVHAEDVASAALHFMDRPLSASPRVYLVSMDADPKNTVSWLWAMHKGMLAGEPEGGVGDVFHLPVVVPYLLRRAIGRGANRGDVRYSSDRIEAEGFKFAFGVEKIVRDIGFPENSQAASADGRPLLP